MPKFRKRPVVIEAFKFGTDEPPDWFVSSPNVGLKVEVRGNERTVLAAGISTLEGTMRAEIGDYVIRGVQGEIYPCKPEIFAATYEPVEETAF